MKKLLLAAAALTLTAGMGMAQTVRIATEGAYPPYNLVNDKGELDGFEIELQFGEDIDGDALTELDEAE